MDAFDCIVQNNPNLKSLPYEILNIIKKYYIEKLINEANENIQARTQDHLYKYYLKEDINYYGSSYSYLCNFKFDKQIQDSFNIVKCVLNNKWFEIGLYPPGFPALRLTKTPTPEWLLQLEKRLHLKYKTDFVHCITQLKLFAGDFKKGNLSRILQFGYNLGRLQEINSNPDYTICFQQVIRLCQAQEWLGLDAYIDILKERFQIGYDTAILHKAN